MARKKDVSDAQFSFEAIAALIAATNVNVSAPGFKLMAKMDPSRGVTGYEYIFRAAKARAKEIQAMEAAGEPDGDGAKAPAKRTKSASSAEGKGAKAGKKRGK